MQEVSDDDQVIAEPKTVQVQFCEELIRISSSESSQNVEDCKNSQIIAEDSQFQVNLEPRELVVQNLIQQSHLVQPHPNQVINSSQKKGSDNESPKKDYLQGLSESIKLQIIIKQAERQRIKGTYKYFNSVLDKYKYHLTSRKIVLTNISAIIDKNKITKAHPIIAIKEYFKNYISICEDFWQKSCKYQLPHRSQNDSKVINLNAELKTGFERLIALRKNTGSQLSRLQKYIKSVVVRIDKTIQLYWGLVASYQSKAISKKVIFEDNQRKFQKRIEKIEKMFYRKALAGEEIQEDLFEEMLKFLKNEKQLRLSIYDWGIQIINLRKRVIEADFNFYKKLQSILSEFKTFNSTVYQFQKKDFDFQDELRQNIDANYLFERLCTPLDSDYILNIQKLIKKQPITTLAEQDFEKYLNEQYFHEVLGDQSQFLRGIIVKSFSLQNQEEELVKTISGNLIHFNKKNFEVKYKMKESNTLAEYQGKTKVVLKQKIIGIIFDNQRIQNIYFRDNNTAEQFLVFIGEISYESA